MIFSVLIAVIVAASLVIVLILIRGGSRKSDRKDVSQRIQKKGKAAVLKEAEKKLIHDPHNVSALELVGDIYFSEKNWEKVWGVYKTLFDISTAHVEINVAKCTLRMGIAAFYMNKLEDAINILMTSIKKEPDNFDCNFYLGQALFKTGVYDKATYCFKKARIIQPENPDVNSYLGQCLFKAQK